MVAFPLPRRLLELWRLRVRGQVMAAAIWRHPHGFEFRLTWNGQDGRAIVYPSLREAQDDGDDTRARLRHYNAEPWR